LLIVLAGLPVPVAQFDVRGAGNGFAGRVDLAWPALRVAVEYDGDHHREQMQFRRDVTRLNALREAGWTVLRFTAPDLIERPEQTVRQIAAVLDERRAA
jgi:very-short-patch-repair endonuclease